MTDLVRELLDTKTADGVTFEVWRYREARQIVKMLPVPVGAGSAATISYQPHVQEVAVHQICVRLESASVILEPGALQYMKGNIDVDVMKHEPGKGWFSRQLASAGTGESPYGVKYTGTGEIWAEPASKHFIIVELDDDGPLLLDDRAFYACSGKVKVDTKKHNTVSGVMSGNQLVQPRLSGYGLAIVESPVSENELSFLTLDGSEKLTVDGDYMLFFSESIDVKLGPLVSGVINMHRSGEGLVFHMTGKGVVCLMPTSRIV
ncbi:AIM24 family protein [Sphingomonas sp. 3-13AW]|uniref:AIM24 family protein n=1 Tax=Sphingomonas sp. 3-13AW TaxID=3050450 RepID=UPI003BB55A0B